MSELTPETLAEWRRDAEHWRDALPTKTDKLQGERILALLDALDEAERNWQLDADRMREAREALARVEALADEYETKSPAWAATVTPRIRAALRGPSDTEGQA